MAGLQCPLDPYVIAGLPLQTRMNLARVLEIELHVSSAGPCIHPSLKDVFLHGPYDGSTPLLLACEEGHLEAVTHIVEEWGADVNAAANYYHNTEKIEEATPIFVAAFQGHSDIVQLLISKGADISTVTSAQEHPEYDGLTPLIGALMANHPAQGFYEKSNDESNKIVRLLLNAGADPSTLAPDGTPVWMRPFCGVDSTIDVINRGLDLKQRNCEDQNILHYWTQSDDTIEEEERLKVIQLIADSDSDLMMIRDKEGFTPILRAAQNCQWNVLDWMLDRDDVDRREKIDALELAGSYLLLEWDEKEEGPKYLRTALQLRDATEERDAIIKIRLEGGKAEWVTPTELEEVIKKPYEYRWVQSMLTRLRIYSGRSLAAVEDLLQSGYFFLHDFEYEESILRGDYMPSDEDAVTILKAYLEAVLKCHPEKPPLWTNADRALQELVRSEPGIRRDEPLCNVSSIQTILELILAVDPDHSLVPYDVFSFLTGLPGVLLNQNIRKLLLRSASRKNALWLDYACHAQDWQSVPHLLHLGVNPNASSDDGNLPLHIVASRGKEHPMVLEGKLEREQVSLETEYNAAHLLFDYGANPYAIDKEGKTAVDLWMEKNCGGKGMQSEAWKNRPYWCRESVPKLSCLAAKTIHIHGIPYSDPGAVPVDCLPVLKKH